MKEKYIKLNQWVKYCRDNDIEKLEDEILEDMDDIWWNMSEKDREEIESDNNIITNKVKKLEKYIMKLVKENNYNIKTLSQKLCDYDKSISMTFARNIIYNLIDIDEINFGAL